MHPFFAYLSKMKHIKRWSLMRNTQEENIKEHSFDTALLAHALAVIGNTYFGAQYDVDHVTTLALFHEAGEVITGDLPTPIKYFDPEIRSAYDRVEQVALQKLYEMLPEEMQPEYWELLFHEGDPHYPLVKGADKLCAYIKCVEEVKSGNMEFAKAKQRIEAELQDWPLPEVQYFIEHFLPAYTLTLDELNS